MDPVAVLILLVLVMLVGSYLAGNIPLVVTLSEAKLKIVTVFGAGLLVGTALAVIIPEGVRALYSDAISHNNAIHEKSLNTAKTDGESSFHQQQSQSDVHADVNNYSSTIGLSLILGFVFMMIVDQISSRRRQDDYSSDRNSTATIGLVVHAAADGVALGAAATTSHQDVEMIVFLAIMLHKAPAAFGLTSFLLHEGIERSRIRKHLMIFSMSAPLLTLLTYFGIGQEQKETLNSINATGIAMLFSAGTFLYVATVHVLPELTSTQHQHHHGVGSGGGGGGGGVSGTSYVHLEQSSGGVTVSTKGYSGLRNVELAILITGALMPLLLTLGHHH